MSTFDWKYHYLNGDITLADALHYFLQEAQAPSFLLAAYERALDEYQGGKNGRVADQISDLAEPFGVAMKQKEKKAMDRTTWVSHVRFHVDSYHEQGFPMTRRSKKGDTAFSKAAELLHRSPSQIEDTYYKG